MLRCVMDVKMSRPLVLCPRLYYTPEMSASSPRLVILISTKFFLVRSLVVAQRPLQFHRGRLLHAADSLRALHSEPDTKVTENPPPKNEFVASCAQKSKGRPAE